MTNWPAGIATLTEETRKTALPVYLVPKDAVADVASEVLPALEKWASLARFSGGLGQVLPTPEGVFVGAGQSNDPFALGAAASFLGEGQFYLATPMEGEALYLATLAWAFSAYRFSRYRTTAPVPTLLVDPEKIDAARLDREAEASSMVRDMVNTPAEEMGPDDVETAVRNIGKSFNAEVSVMTGEALEEGFPLIHAVGRAADKAPRLIDVKWGDPAHPAITLVGKGVCFDSGGLNIKGTAGMALMKKDMGGAANALGLARMIMEAGVPCRLRLLIPAVENAISGNAFRPGDVFRSRKGLTVEISNTDAEGRLILSDALTLAAEAKPDHIISLATLTGAARVALGPDLPPVYSTDAAFRERIVQRSHELADPLWPMPFWDRYDDYLDSSVADVNHAASTSFAGSITAALFLRRFVPTEIPYTHLDLFAWSPKARPGHPQGGEAMGIRSLFDVLAESVAGRKNS